MVFAGRAHETEPTEEEVDQMDAADAAISGSR
jgi:hypothetical protein